MVGRERRRIECFFYSLTSEVFTFHVIEWETRQARSVCEIKRKKQSNDRTHSEEIRLPKNKKVFEKNNQIINRETKKR